MPDYPILVGHCDFGDPDCCGIIMPVVRGEQCDLVCNECRAVIATVPAVEAEQTLLRMAMSEGICTETCPHCGAINTFPGFTSMEAYTCRQCGTGVVLQRSMQ
jgi:hypothetical protein